MTNPRTIWEVEYQGKRYVGLACDIAKELNVDRHTVYLSLRDYKVGGGAYSGKPDADKYIKFISKNPIREIFITDPKGVTRKYHNFYDAEIDNSYSAMAMSRKAFKGKGMDGYTIVVKDNGNVVSV